MSDNEEMKANRPALAILSIAGILIAISIATVLLVPGPSTKIRRIATTECWTDQRTEQRPKRWPRALKRWRALQFT